MGVPLNHPFYIHLNGIFLYKPSILGYPHFWKTPYIKIRHNTSQYVNIHQQTVEEILHQLKTLVNIPVL